MEENNLIMMGDTAMYTAYYRPKQDNTALGWITRSDGVYLSTYAKIEEDAFKQLSQKEYIEGETVAFIANLAFKNARFARFEELKNNTCDFYGGSK